VENVPETVADEQDWSTVVTAFPRGFCDRKPASARDRAPPEGMTVVSPQLRSDLADICARREPKDGIERLFLFSSGRRTPPASDSFSQSEAGPMRT